MLGMLNQLAESQLPTDMLNPTKLNSPAMNITQPPTTIASQTQIKPQTPLVQAVNIQATSVIPPTVKIYNDPLREIIHLSDSKESSEYEGKIKSLAAEAANLYHVEEVKPVSKV